MTLSDALWDTILILLGVGVSFVLQKLSVGGRPEPPPSLILQKCVIPDQHASAATTD